MKRLLQVVMIVAAVAAWAVVGHGEAGPISNSLVKDDLAPGSGLVPRNYINLEITGLRFTSYGGGRQVWLQVTNRGGLDLNSAGGWLSLYINPERRPTCGAPATARLTLGILRAGASRWYVFPRASLPDGPYHLWGFADSACEIPELLEDDNLRYFPPLYY